jgi:putative N6-adenine-specific DNA methylase
MIAKTLTGLEGVLAEELNVIGAADVKQLKRAVEFTGDTHMLYKANLWCRKAISILKPVFDFEFQNQDEFYEKLRAFQWDDIFSVDKTIAISAVASNSVFTNTQFVAQRSKDAIADYFREKTNTRPSVNIEDPQIKINIFINRNFCSVSLDSSGSPLFKRGYRKNAGMAPLSEVLAAGLIAISGWDKQSPFYDPMCGSGTFSIEAALMALNIAPGSFRNQYAFQNWQGFESSAWEDLKVQANEGILKKAPDIIASDISNKTMTAARQNLMEAGLLGLVKLEKKDFFTARPAHDHGVVFLNPPYGRRLENENIQDFFKSIGAVLKHKYSGFEAWIISPDKSLTHKIGLRTSTRLEVFNGQLDCQFLGYKLYEGTKKIHKTPEKRPSRPRI